MLKFLIGVLVGVVIAAAVLPENVRLREPLYQAWLTTRVFVAEMLSEVDEAAERATEAAQQATRDAGEAAERATERAERTLGSEGQDTRAVPQEPVRADEEPTAAVDGASDGPSPDALPEEESPPPAAR